MASPDRHPACSKENLRQQALRLRHMFHCGVPKKEDQFRAEQVGTQRFFTFIFVYVLFSLTTSLGVAASQDTGFPVALTAPAALGVCILGLNLWVPAVRPHLLHVLSLSLMLVALWSTWSVTSAIQTKMLDYEHHSLRLVWEELADNPTAKGQLRDTLERLMGKAILAQHNHMIYGLCTIVSVAGLGPSTILALLSSPVIILTGIVVMGGSFVTPDVIGNITAGTLFFTMQNLGIASFRRRCFNLQYEFEERLEASVASSGAADSILNHTLKNMMADAAGGLEIYLEGDRTNSHAVVTAIECLQRGMVSCHNRESYMQLCRGTYSSTAETLDLRKWADSLMAGRQMTTEVATVNVEADKVL